MTDGTDHVPVLPVEVLRWLDPKPGDAMADLTLGAGGHAALVLEATAPDGRLVALDRDDAAIAIAASRLTRFGDRLTIIRARFSEAAERLAGSGFDGFRGVLLDLGVSSMQLDDAERGFSFQHDGPLDMRMTTDGRLTAADVVNEWSEGRLETILRDYGEEPRARAIARKIVDVRRRVRISRTAELAELVRSVTGSRGRIHPATRTFQAIRIAVNEELDEIERVLPRTVELLAPGGRLAVISFHSLEDRLVKAGFRDEQERGHGRVLTVKPVQATDDEARRNPRSRSAKLRVFERS